MKTKRSNTGLFLCFLLVFSIPEYPDISDTFTIKIPKNVIKFLYSSKVILKNGEKYIRNTIQTNYTEKLWLKWSSANMAFNHNSPFIKEYSLEIPSSFPARVFLATVCIGGTSKLCSAPIISYIDNDRLRFIGNRYKTKARINYENGENIELDINTFYNESLKSSLLELELIGNASLIVEKTKGLVIADSTNWKVSTLLNTNETLLNVAGSKDIQDVKEVITFVQPENTVKEFFYCQNLNNRQSYSKISFICSSNKQTLDDIKICILNGNHRQTFAFVAKSFVSI